MINTTDLQAFLEKIEGGCLGVDLVKIGQNYAQQQANRKFIFSCFYSFIHSSFHFSVPGTRNVPKYGNLASIGKFRVALDIEQCLDRFYGGYYSGECLNTEKKSLKISLINACLHLTDWACGGQWNRAFQFVQLLASAFESAQMEVTVFFDGTLRENKKLALDRNDFRQRTISVSYPNHNYSRIFR